MASLSVGECFTDRSAPEVVWSVAGIVETREGPFALLLTADSTRFCEVRIDTLLSGERFVPAARRDG